MAQERRPWSRRFQGRGGVQAASLLGQDVRQVAELVVAGHAIAVGRGDGDERLLEVSVLPTGRPEVGSGAGHLHEGVRGA